MLLHSIIRTIFGDPSEKRLKSYQKELAKVRVWEEKFANLPDLAAVQAEMTMIRARFEGLDMKDHKNIVQIQALTQAAKYEVFALHRRASTLLMGHEYTLADGSTTTWKLIPYDVQILGAMALIDGNIAEMRTGEGKTFVATIAASLAAVAGYPIHIVTVNDYLASRDRSEMTPIYEALGFTT